MGQNCNHSNKLVVIGSVGAPFGVEGWLKINSYTEPRGNILQFESWLLVNDENSLNHEQKINLSSIKIKQSHNNILVLFTDIKDRTEASLLTNKKIVVSRHDLPELDVDQYYWEDLIGLNVYNLSGQLVGVVDYLFSTAANDVMVVKTSDDNNTNNNKEHLIPYSLGDTIKNINLLDKTILVDWKLD